MTMAMAIQQQTFLVSRVLLSGWRLPNSRITQSDQQITRRAPSSVAVQVFTVKHLERTPGKPPLRSLKEIPPRVLGAENTALTPTEKLRTVRNNCANAGLGWWEEHPLSGIIPWYLAGVHFLSSIVVWIRVISPL